MKATTENEIRAMVAVAMSPTMMFIVATIKIGVAKHKPITMPWKAERFSSCNCNDTMIANYVT